MERRGELSNVIVYRKPEYNPGAGGIHSYGSTSATPEQASGELQRRVKKAIGKKGVK